MSPGPSRHSVHVRHWPSALDREPEPEPAVPRSRFTAYVAVAGSTGPVPAAHAGNPVSAVRLARERFGTEPVRVIERLDRYPFTVLADVPPDQWRSIHEPDE